MRRIALVTCRAARGLDEDMPPLLGAFAAAGAAAEIADWDDKTIEWSRFDVGVLRSAWDYAERRAEFLAWAARAATATVLLNALPVVRWNSDKHYLADLTAAGLPVVPTRYAESARDAPHVLEEFLAEHAARELVVKPAIGAGARGVRRHDRGATTETLAHIQSLLASGRSAMLQPYLEDVDVQGEVALMFIDGGFSHAVRKCVRLPRGASSTADLFAAERIAAYVPDSTELVLAERVMARLPFTALLYARLDLVRDHEGQPRVLELEITEPSMYFAYARGSAERFVAGVLARLASS